MLFLTQFNRVKYFLFFFMAVLLAKQAFQVRTGKFIV